MRVRSWNVFKHFSRILPMSTAVEWPDGKRFAFTVFDDTDHATLENIQAVYSLLTDCGLRTSKSCWAFNDDPKLGKNPGQTLEDDNYRQWLLDLRDSGFDIDFHGASWNTSLRERIAAALERFAEVFGHYPRVIANHTGQIEGIYWGNARLAGLQSAVYDAMTQCRNHNKYRGHVEGDEHFWGDFCREKIKYTRNFVYQDINTLKICPFMPYHDSTKPYVNYWFASSTGTMSRCSMTAYRKITKIAWRKRAGHASCTRISQWDFKKAMA